MTRWRVRRTPGARNPDTEKHGGIRRNTEAMSRGGADETAGDTLARTQWAGRAQTRM